MKPFEFTDEERGYANGHTVVDEALGVRLVWDIAAMGWDVYSLATGNWVRVIYPEHERMRADPANAPIYALIARGNKPRAKLRLVR